MDANPGVLFEKRCKTSCVVPVNMGENNKVDFRGLNPDLPHVGEQGPPVAACIKENGFFKPPNQTRESPARLQPWVKPVVVVKNGQVGFHGSNSRPSRLRAYGLAMVRRLVPLICLKLAPWLTHLRARSASITLVPDRA